MASQIVDEAIDATATHFNLRDVIEDFRHQADEAKDQKEKNSMIERGASVYLIISNS